MIRASPGQFGGVPNDLIVTAYQTAKGLINLGGVVNLAFLVAVFISNLPEGVAGSINLEAADFSCNKILRMWLLLVRVSAVCAGFGYLMIGRLPETDGRIGQAFAAGAMLADAMMPEAFEHGGKMVGLFTALGFLMAATLSVIG